ncbi:MAG: flagellar brake protein [Armatimonadetes bacterium]|nr:flagellar brake protein [Armatimonadota bacterium]
MNESFRLIATVVLLLGGSMLISYCVTWYVSSRGHRVELAPNSPVRLIGTGGSYRCLYLRTEGKTLVFSSPLQADRYVPLRPGEKVLVHAPGDGHFLAFRCEVGGRKGDIHEIHLLEPSYVRRVDRRSEFRSTDNAGEDVMLNGDMASMVDLSANGACIVAGHRPQPGERILLALPSAESYAFGWVLDCIPAPFGRRLGYRVRIRFIEPMSGLTTASR